MKIELVKIKVRIARGQSWISYFHPLFYLAGIANLSFLRDNMLGIGTVYVVGCWAIGYIDQKYGIWLAESAYGTKELNPVMTEIYNNVKR